MSAEWDEYRLVYDFGHGNGLEVICTEYSLADIKRAKQWYIENTDIYPAIVRKRAGKEVKAHVKKSSRAS